MGTEIDTLEQLDKYSNHLSYSNKIEKKGPLDIKGFLKRAVTGKEYQNISPEEYLEMSSDILAGLKDAGEKYDREFHRNIRGHEKVLEEDHEFSYRKAVEMVEKGMENFSINYRDPEDKIEIHTFNTESLEGYDQILADIDAEFEEIDKEEFLEYKEVLEDLGFE